MTSSTPASSGANPTDFSIARLLERIAVHAEALTSHDETGCQMTSDKFRVRADRYIKTACAVTDPVHKLALVDVAQRWLRLAAQIDAGAAIQASRSSEAPATQVRSALVWPAFPGDGAPYLAQLDFRLSIMRFVPACVRA